LFFCFLDRLHHLPNPDDRSDRRSDYVGHQKHTQVNLHQV
jgi:hypothetical protein